MKCVYCEKEAKSHHKNQSRVCCSRECEQSYNEQLFKDKFNTKFAGRLEYAGGYIHSDKSFTLRCLGCGKQSERKAQCIRAGHRDTRCDVCYKLEMDNKKIHDKLLKTQFIINKAKDRAILKAIQEQSKKIKQIELYNTNHSKICITCDNKYIGTTMFCSDKCKRKYNNRYKELRIRKLKLNGNVQLDISLEKLVNRDNNVCHICGQACDGNDYITDNNNFVVGKTYPSIDHVVPVSKGGTHTWDNVKLAHFYCNTIKSNKDIYINSDGRLMMVM